MFVCPSCRRQLVRARSESGVLWACPGCQGRAATLGLLRRIIAKDCVNRLWSLAREGKGARGRHCPSCDKPMIEVFSAPHGEGPGRDVCRACQMVWFDPKEFEGLPREPSQARADADLSPKAREALALQKVEQIAKQAEAREGAAPPEEGWKWLPAILGMPVECEVNAVSRLPLVTWGLAALICGVSVWAFFDLARIVKEFGLVPAQAWRHGGLTFLTSFVLHGGLLHLLGNVYFLLIFGDNVEEALGRRRYLALVLLAALAGDLLHVATDPRAQLPCIGASSGISGIIVFYALKFPHARLGFLFRFYWSFRWVRISARTALLLWLLLQFLGAWQQVAGFTNVSALAHLGGAAVGFAFWLVCRES